MMHRRWPALSMLALFVAVGTGASPLAVLAADPRLEVTVHGDSVRWFGAPGTVVRAELIGPSGLKASAAARNTSYNVALRFTPVIPGGDARILPGDVVTVTPESGEVLRAVVPELVADADAAGDRILGRAPPGVALEVIRDFDKPLGTVTSTPDGDVVFGLGGIQDVARGFTGQIRFVTADQIAFTTWYDVTDVSMWVATRRLEVRASLATTVTVTVRAPSGSEASHTVTFARPAYSAGPFRCPDCPELEPGSLVTVTKQGALSSLDDDWTGQVPELGVRLDRGRNIVRGWGPPGESVTATAGEVKLFWRDQPTVRENVAPDPTGQFELDLTGTATIVPGWMARVTYPVAPAVTLFGEDLLRVVRATVWGPHLEGVVAPSVAVTLTLTAPDGASKAEAVANSDLTGAYSLWFGSASGLPVLDGPFILPGDTLRIDEQGTGDPVFVEVPRLTVRADAATDTVSGEVPPGYEVEVGTGQSGIKRTAAQQDDHYTVDFAGVGDLARGMAGPVVLRQQAGRFEFHTCWAITDLDLLLGVGTTGGVAGLRGDGCAGRGVRVRWLTPDGRQVADYREVLRPEGIPGLSSPTHWSAGMQDSSGRGLDMLPGDRFEVDVGDDHVAVTVPELTIDVDVAADTMNGRTMPNITVTVGARRRGTSGETFNNTTVSEANGQWHYDYRGTFDIQHGDSVGAGIRTTEGYQVRRMVEAPGLLLDLNDARLTGVSLANGDLVAELMEGGTARSQATSRTPGDGAFEIVFHTADAALRRPQAGDTVRVSVQAGDLREDLAMQVPDLAFDVNPATRVVAGRATPGGILRLHAVGTLFSAQGTDGIGTSGSFAPAIAADGTWTARLEDFGSPGGSASAVALLPGLQLAASYRLPEGHMATLRSYLPVANVEHGGPRVCGAGPAEALVEATVADADGAIRGRTEGRVGDDLRFDLVLRDAAGQPVATRTGDTVRTVVGDARIDMTLPTLTLNVQWRSMRPGRGWPESLVEGTGPPLRQAYLRAPASDCFTGAAWHSVREFLSGTSDAGAYRVNIDHQAAGGGVEVAFLTPDRHRFFRHAVRAQARIFVDTDRVAGRGQPLQPVTLTLRSVEGNVLGRANGHADVDGRFDLGFLDDSGQPVSSRAGDTVHLATMGDSADVVVQPLTFDFGLRSGVLGLTVPGAAIQLTVRLVDGTVRRFAPVADASGRLGFSPGDIPAREAWSLADVQEIALTLKAPGGHEIVAEGHVNAVERSTVFLPFAALGRRAGRSSP